MERSAIKLLLIAALLSAVVCSVRSDDTPEQEAKDADSYVESVDAAATDAAQQKVCKRHTDCQAVRAAARELRRVMAPVPGTAGRCSRGVQDVGVSSPAAEPHLAFRALQTFEQYE
jgi:hypothetical protein